MKTRNTVITFIIAVTAAMLPLKESFARDSYVGEILWVPYNFCPRNFINADGQILPISQNQALFSLLGTTYGGDGRSTFAVPDLRGRVAVHSGVGTGLGEVRLGEKAGAETVTLTSKQVPSKNQIVNAGLPAADKTEDGYISASLVKDFYIGAPVAGKTPDENSVAREPVEIRMPYLALKACIAVNGIYPSRN